jgi:16S rRNA (cytosine1402-N4)-methyltransferase
MRSPSAGGVGVPFSARFHSVRSGRNPDGVSVEGLRMSREFEHQPVMREEVVALLSEVPEGTVLDATVGAGGHAAALLDVAPGVRLVGLDQDPAAIAAAGRTLAAHAERVILRRARFDRLGAILDSLEIPTLAGALFDLGVSSPQLDEGARGFSYRHPGPLDMRMDPDGPVTAADVVNRWNERDLAAIIAANGEQRFARRIARAIVAGRPMSTTTDLAATVRDAIPAAVRRHGGHPARRVFQAIRIAVNDELVALPAALDAAIDRLVPRGRVVVIAYHSGEDRIVKDRLAFAATGGCTCPPGLPCQCGAVPRVRLLNRRARRPSADEVAANRRAESARLRAAEALDEERLP